MLFYSMGFHLPKWDIYIARIFFLDVEVVQKTQKISLEGTRC